MSYRAGTTVTLTTAPLGVSGLVGTITAALVVQSTGATVIAPTTVGIVESPAASTVYAWTILLPADIATGDYGIRWVAGANDAAETIHVLGASAPLAYATAEDLQAHDLAGLINSLALGPVQVDALLARAERDIDRVLGPLPARDDTGLKLSPADDLTVHERAALARAVATQALHRIQALGEGTGVTPEQPRKSVKGPDFAVEYAIDDAAGATATQPLAPGVARELAPLKHLRPLGARART